MSWPFKTGRRRHRQRLVTIPEYRARNAARGGDGFSPRMRTLLTVGFAALMVYLAIASQMGLWRTVSLWQLRSDLADRRLDLAAEVVDLDIRRQLLESDTLYIEQVARTEYHFSRPDEIVYELTGNK